MKYPPAQNDPQQSNMAHPRSPSGVVVDRQTVDLKRLEKRIGRVHLQQRLGIEADHATQIFGRGRTFFTSKTGIRFTPSSASLCAGLGYIAGACAMPPRSSSITMTWSFLSCPRRSTASPYCT